MIYISMVYTISDWFQATFRVFSFEDASMVLEAYRIGAFSRVSRRPIQYEMQTVGVKGSLNGLLVILNSYSNSYRGITILISNAMHLGSNFLPTIFWVIVYFGDLLSLSLSIDDWSYVF